jgi:serine/threonine protein kinase
MPFHRISEYLRFSKVYRVRDDVENKERALKLFDSAAGNEAVRREIGALREIHHPKVVEVFWAGQSNAGDWYLITEFIDGEPLEEFVTGERNLRDREAVDVALDLLEALVAFHPDEAGRGVHSRGAESWRQLMAGSGGSHGLPAMALAMASSAVMPWAAAVSR